MMIKRHLAVDLGAESGRAVAGFLENGKLTLEEIYRFPTAGLFVNGSMRWDIYRFFSEIKEALRIYSRTYGPELASIGVDSWGVDFGLLDRRGKLTGIPYHYRDSRNEGADKLIDSTIGNRRLYELTGIQMLPINTLNQLAAMKRDEDPALEYGRNLMFIGDLLHYFMTGKAVSEFTAASISQLYNPFKGSWDDEILKSFGLPEDLKTPIIQAGSFIGMLKKDIMEDCGLSGEVRVIAPAVHDTASSAAAVPSQGEKWGYISSGTWSIAGMELDGAVTGDRCFEMNISNSGGAFGKTLFLKNVMGLWIIQQCLKEWKKTVPDLEYAAIVEKAESVHGSGAFIDPDAPDFLNPPSMTEAVSGYLRKTGQAAAAQRAAAEDNIGLISRIVFESLAMKYRFVFDRLKAAADKELETLHIIGGGTKNSLLNQLTADIMGIRVLTGPVEASAAGNILLQAFGCGELGSHEEIREAVRNSFVLDEYLPSETYETETAYSRFLKATGLEG